jgi:(2Fe-2S) ferredoxin
MEPFPQHVFICTQQKPEGVTSCPCNGSLRVLQSLERELRSQRLDDEVQLTTCGCLGLCDDGPIMITYPEGVWYHKVKEDDVPEIVHSHLRSGKPVERLVWSDSQAMKLATTEHREHYRALVSARDEAGILPEELNEMMRAFMSSRTILTALELDIFTAVASGASAENVAQIIHTDPRATEMLLNALAGLKLLEKKDGTFFNTAETTRFFSKGSSDDARGGLLHIANPWHRWSTLTECVRTGTSVEARTREANWVSAFIAAMDRNAKERAGAVVKAVGTDGIRRVLDLGGGSGAYSIAFAHAVPGLKSEILDLGDVVPIARENIRKAGLEDRITTRVGDMLRDSLGENYDLILVLAICHMFSPEENH